MENNVLMGALRDFARSMRGETGSGVAENNQGDHMDIRVDNDVIANLAFLRDYADSHDDWSSRAVHRVVSAAEDCTRTNSSQWSIDRISFIDNSQRSVDYDDGQTYTFEGWGHAASSIGNATHDYCNTAIKFKNGRISKTNYSQEKINTDFDDDSEELDNFLSSFKLR